ncbi:MAG: PHP domain-containing protein [Gammaproteobacteria bacterium]|nr:PHP domain-containing protein [Gammaproteobacteria bacterium]
MDSERIDLHTHSRHSDGLLAPAELVALAARRGVRLLALTDHDTVAGCGAAAAACAASGICFVPGVELTCQWRGREIHVLGLAVRSDEPLLTAHLADVAQRRRQRLAAIRARLVRAGLDGEGIADSVAAAKPVPTRTDIARELVRRGLAGDVTTAFGRWLGPGRPGHVPVDWPELDATVRCIGAAGGHAVLAHPHRYPLSNGALRELCSAFRTCGGAAIEVSLAGMGPGDADRMAALARRCSLAGSVGSDFHEPGLPWRPLGRFAKLPDGIAALSERLSPQAP